MLISGGAIAELAVAEAPVAIVLTSSAAARTGTRATAVATVTIANPAAASRSNTRASAAVSVSVAAAAAIRTNTRASAHAEVIPPDPTTTRVVTYAVLSASNYGPGVTKFGAYGIFNASLHETTVGVPKFLAYGIYVSLIPVPVPTPAPPRKKRLPVGMAEYTETVGLDGYLLKGAIPSFATLRSQLRDRELIRYRVTNSVIEEIGKARFDWGANVVVRLKGIVPTTMIDWPAGRKILHVLEDYTPPGVGVLALENTPLSVGIAEYTLTEGLGPYQLRGALREFFTLKGRIPHGAKVRYRATNIAKEEVSEGIFDAVNNQLIRNQSDIPTTPVDWGPGRKLIYIIEK
jgi:hypothetical protein